MKLLSLTITCFLTLIVASEAKLTLIEQSRKSCVKISSEANKSHGTGFFISDDCVVTCFHVISKLERIDDKTSKCSLFEDLKVETEAGEVIDAKCVSIPNNSHQDPLQFDFAILKLVSKPKISAPIIKLHDSLLPINVGDEIIFSSYPLATPAMVTHKGMISGIDRTGNIICIQAPINKGNSGGAILSTSGKAYGIISMREGGISQGLQELSQSISQSEKSGSITLMGVNPLASINAVINTLDTYISTGIGYAISIRHLRDYITSNPKVLK